MQMTRWTVASFTIDHLLPTWTFKKKTQKHRRTLAGLIDGQQADDEDEVCYQLL
jgi:hypothetical protein